MTPAAWSKRDDLKSQWRTFMQTEAFKEAIRMLERNARPFLTRTDTPDSRATRQAYQSGFQDCIDLLQKLATYDKKAEEAVVFSEWAHYGQPDKDTNR